MCTHAMAWVWSRRQLSGVDFFHCVGSRLWTKGLWLGDTCPYLLSHLTVVSSLPLGPASCSLCSQGRRPWTVDPPGFSLRSGSITGVAHPAQCVQCWGQNPGLPQGRPFCQRSPRLSQQSPFHKQFVLLSLLSPKHQVWTTHLCKYKTHVQSTVII